MYLIVDGYSKKHDQLQRIQQLFHYRQILYLLSEIVDILFLIMMQTSVMVFYHMCHLL